MEKSFVRTENENYKFVMLSEGAWQGGKSIYYKLTKIK